MGFLCESLVKVAHMSETEEQLGGVCRGLSLEIEPRSSSYQATMSTMLPVR